MSEKRRSSGLCLSGSPVSLSVSESLGVWLIRWLVWKAKKRVGCRFVACLVGFPSRRETGRSSSSSLFSFSAHSARLLSSAFAGRLPRSGSEWECEVRVRSTKRACRRFGACLTDA